MGKSLIPAQRRERIHEYLVAHKIVSTALLCEMLDVSDATIRRDLEWLENDGLVRGELKRLANGQERRYYSITAKGRKLLARKLAVWSTFTSAMGLVLKPARP